MAFWLQLALTVVSAGILLFSLAASSTPVGSRNTGRDGGRVAHEGAIHKGPSQERARGNLFFGIWRIGVWDKEYSLNLQHSMRLKGPGGNYKGE